MNFGTRLSLVRDLMIQRGLSAEEAIRQAEIAIRYAQNGPAAEADSRPEPEPEAAQAKG